MPYDFRVAGVISFLSDFGHADPYVGICHAVMLGVTPEVRIVDICHEVPPGCVRVGAAMLAQAAPYLPHGVILGVVDPGVGTGRRAVVLTAGNSTLVGPDNGLLPWAADALGGIDSAYEISNPELMLGSPSSTFHGRDIFSPVAARLAGGLPATEVGPPLQPTGLVRLPEPTVRWADGELHAEVLTIDRYGNVQTAAAGRLLPEMVGDSPAGAGIIIGGAGGESAAVLGETFGSVPPGHLVVYEDSAGLIAIAVNGGRADEHLGVTPGSVLRVRPVQPGETAG